MLHSNNLHFILKLTILSLLLIQKFLNETGAPTMGIKLTIPQNRAKFIIDKENITIQTFTLTKNE